VTVSLTGALRRLEWEARLIELNRHVAMAQEIARKAVAQRLAETRREQGKLRVMASINWDKPAYLVERELPRDLPLLRDLVKEERWTVEQRAKILEVIILRGADNRFGYHNPWPAALAPEAKSWKERQQYQQLAMTTVMSGPPQLFERLSGATVALPDHVGGRYPATEFMNTMLRKDGLLGDYESRQRFTEWLVALPPEQRGQAMFHVRDAAGAQERGKVAQLSGFELSGGPVGFGLSWDNARDAHWDIVSDGVVGPVEESLGYNKRGEADAATLKQREEFYTGYRLADRGLSVGK
jgi:hypothetical protein